MKGCFDGCVVLRECVISIVIPGDIAEYYHISHISPPAAQMVSHLHPDSSLYHPYCWCFVQTAIDFWQIAFTSS